MATAANAANDETEKWANVWTHRPYSPFVMRLCLKATVTLFPQRFPSKITQGGSHWENGVENYFYLQNELSETVNEIATETLEKPDFLYDFLNASLLKAKELNEFSSRVSPHLWRDKSNGELTSFVKDFSEMFVEMYSYATLMPLLGYLQENPLYAKTNEILREKTREKPEKFAYYLLTLTRPLKKLETQEQELEVLRLARKAKLQGLGASEEIGAAFEKEVGALSDAFSWLSFDLCDSVAWNAGHYAGLVAEKTLLPVEAIDASIEFNERYEKNAVGEFERACSELKLSQEEKRVFELLRDLGYYKFAREQEFIQALYNAKTVQDELGLRAGLFTTESKYVLTDEWASALKHHLDFKRLTASRWNNCLIMAFRDGTVRVIDGTAAAMAFSEFAFETESGQESVSFKGVLEGTPACAGRARGAVRVINSASQSGKMVDGAVLVSAATMPDLVPALKRAAAIVTSEGGVTCHAAIVARELGIPCVVGVRNVHKILRDGDEVEVDATAGIIRKL